MISEKIDKFINEKKSRNFKYALRMTLLVILFGAISLGALTKSSSEIVVVVEFISPVAKDHKAWSKVFFVTEEGVRASMHRPPLNIHIDIGDKILCEKIITYHGVSIYEFIKKL